MPRRRTITAEAVRARALALPHAIESSHFAQPDFRVKNRIFATLPNRPAVVCVKTTPANLDALVATDPLAFSDEWRGRWLCVRLDRVSVGTLEDLLLEAWALVAPKALVKAFAASR
jgi:hypothetical protein